MVCDVHTTSFSKKEEEKATHDTYHRELGVPCLLPYTLYTYKLEIVPIAVIIRGRESGAVMSRRRPAAAIVSSSSWLCHHGRHTTTIRKEQRSVNILGILLISLLLIHARKVNAFCLRNSQRRSSTIPTFSATEVDHDDLMVDNLQPHLVFPGGGIFFYWQAGVVSYLREQQYDLSCCTFAGASAGALTATLTSTGVDFYQATDRALELAAEAGVWDRKGGLQGIWGPIIEQWLDELLPPEAETIVQGKLSLLVTPIPSFGKTQVNDFQDRQDLIRCNMASVHLPWFLDGKWTSNFRQQAHIDGSFLSSAKDYLPQSPTTRPNNLVTLDWTKDPAMAERGGLDFVEALSPDGIYSLLEQGKKYAKELESRGKFKRLKKKVPSLV